MALFTFGEGYHNYHHEFQHDYRNGVKWWQWDPTKWSIWTLAKLRLVTGLRRVSEEKILIMQLAEARRRLDERLACNVTPLQGRMRLLLQHSGAKLHHLGERWTALKAEYAENHLGDRWTALKAEYAEKKDLKVEHIRAALAEIRHEVRHAFDLLELASATA